MPLNSITLLCTQKDIEHYLSAAGVKQSVDDNEDGYVSADEQQAITDAIAEASETAYFYLWQKYSPTSLSGSNLVCRKVAIFAAYRIRGRKGNRVPEQVEKDAADAEELFEKISSSDKLLPGVPLRRTLAPVASYTRVDARYNFRCIRVERNNSSQWNPTTLTQNTDYVEAYTWEI